MESHDTASNQVSICSLRRTFLFVGLLAALLSFAQSASAGLIVNSVRYDGYVRDGNDTGIEKHFTDDGFPPLNMPTHDLPAVDPNPPSPLNPANDLFIMSFTELPSVALGSEFYPYAEIWISRFATGDLFANPLDTTLGMPPVELELELYDEDLPPIQPGQEYEKLIFAYIGVEGGGTTAPHPGPASITATGRGSEDDPLQITLGLNADQVNLNNRLGQVKVAFYWDRMVVPEPASFALAGLGCVGLLGLSHRRCK